MYTKGAYYMPLSIPCARGTYYRYQKPDDKEWKSIRKWKQMLICISTTREIN